jgi:bifunctional UDP-N-acetylglucosamine pyrophosphorylase/glucosamine-1-phosphate N-acetyltransferase
MSFSAIILAAGKGTRLKSELPKPLHKVAGMPLLGWVTGALNAAGADNILTVISPESPQIKEWLSGSPTVIQDPQNGTGHAALCCLDRLEVLGNNPVIILFADTPLVTSNTISGLVKRVEDSADICVLGFHTDQPDGYGRLVCDSTGKLTAIIEHKDATEEQRTIGEVNSGIMCAKASVLLSLLPKLTSANAQSELYLTDIVRLGVDAGMIATYALADPAELIGINDRAQLAEAEAVAQERLRHAAMLSGVTLTDPSTVFFCADTRIERDVIVEPHVVFGPGVHIGAGTTIKAFSHIEETVCGTDCLIGPYARLRPGTKLGNRVKIGNFVEVKKTTMQDGAKANHLAYLGDSEIGSNANIGAGTITCNYDGFKKAKTIIGTGAFIGSNTALVAPVTIGAGAIIGAGSTITQSVAENALAISRAEQSHKQDAAKRFRQRQAEKKIKR